MSTSLNHSAAAGSRQAPPSRHTAPTRHAAPSRHSAPSAAPASGRSTNVPVLQCQGLSRVYPLPGRREGVAAVKSVSLSLEAGSFTALVGASGCGKSTLLTCLAGLDRPTHGTVSVLGQQSTGLSARAAARLRAERVGFVFQDDNLVTALSARENVALPGRLRRRPLSRAQVSEALGRVGLSAQASQLPHELSGGERQRVAIARVLASRPAIVFADEPTASLDVAGAAGVLDWFAELAAEGTAVLMVTHDAQAASRADRVLVMDAGRVIGQLPGGDPAAVADAVLSARTGGGH